MNRLLAIARHYDATVLLLDEAIAATEAGDKERAVAAMRQVLETMDQATSLFSGSAPVPMLQ